MAQSHTSGRTTFQEAGQFDAALRYDLGASNPGLNGLSVSINALNLANDKPAICNDGYRYLSQGRTVLGSLRYRW